MRTKIIKLNKTEVDSVLNKVLKTIKENNIYSPQDVINIIEMELLNFIDKKLEGFDIPYDEVYLSVDDYGRTITLQTDKVSEYLLKRLYESGLFEP